jgi:hypothetical protein
MSVKVVVIEDQPRPLGRQVVHDDRSRSFPLRTGAVDRSTWRDKAVRIYDPLPNPNQQVGCCTMCAKAMQFNSVGNRVTGEVLDMGWALDGYRIVTRIDPFEGHWEPDDTGSSALASCKAAQSMGKGADYRWVFDGVDGVVQAIMNGAVVSVGTWWYDSMFDLLPGQRIEVYGDRVGGHQYVARGYDVSSDMVLCRCWWGTYRDFWIKRSDLGLLLADDGDAHVQRRLV